MEDDLNFWDTQRQSYSYGKWRTNLILWQMEDNQNWLMEDNLNFRVNGRQRQF